VSDLGIGLDMEREFFERVLADECVGYADAAGEATWDEETGTSVYESDTVIYEGPCSVFQSISDRRIEEGGNPSVLGEWVVRVPVSAEGFASGSTVEITSIREGGDPELVGKVFVVRRVGVRSEAILRRLFCDVREPTAP
jgi:hypothetical protein